MPAGSPRKPALRRQASSVAEQNKLQVTDAASGASKAPRKDLDTMLREGNANAQKVLEPVRDQIISIRDSLRIPHSQDTGKQAFLKFAEKDTIKLLLGKALGNPKRMEQIPWMEQSIGIHIDDFTKALSVSKLGSRARLTDDGMWLRRVLSPHQTDTGSLFTLLVNEGHGVEKWIVSIVDVGGMSKNMSLLENPRLLVNWLRPHTTCSPFTFCVHQQQWQLQLPIPTRESLMSIQEMIKREQQQQQALQLSMGMGMGMDMGMGGSVEHLTSVEYMLLHIMAYPVPKSRRTHYRHDSRPVTPSQTSSGNATGIGSHSNSSNKLSKQISMDRDGGVRSVFSLSGRRPFSLCFRDAGAGSLMDGNAYAYLVKTYLDAFLPPTLREVVPFDRDPIAHAAALAMAATARFALANANTGRAAGGMGANASPASVMASQDNIRRWAEFGNQLSHMQMLVGAWLQDLQQQQIHKDHHKEQNAAQAEGGSNNDRQEAASAGFADSGNVQHFAYGRSHPENEQNSAEAVVKDLAKHGPVFLRTLELLWLRGGSVRYVPVHAHQKDQALRRRTDEHQQHQHDSPMLSPAARLNIHDAMSPLSPGYSPGSHLHDSSRARPQENFISIRSALDLMPVTHHQCALFEGVGAASAGNAANEGKGAKRLTPADRDALPTPHLCLHRHPSLDRDGSAQGGGMRLRSGANTLNMSHDFGYDDTDLKLDLRWGGQKLDIDLSVDGLNGRGMNRGSPLRDSAGPRGSFGTIESGGYKAPTQAVLEALLLSTIHLASQCKPLWDRKHNNHHGRMRRLVAGGLGDGVGGKGGVELAEGAIKSVSKLFSTTQKKKKKEGGDANGGTVSARDGSGYAATAGASYEPAYIAPPFLQLQPALFQFLWLSLKQCGEDRSTVVREAGMGNTDGQSRKSGRHEDMDRLPMVVEVWLAVLRPWLAEARYNATSLVPSEVQKALRETYPRCAEPPNASCSDDGSIVLDGIDAPDGAGGGQRDAEHDAAMEKHLLLEKQALKSMEKQKKSASVSGSAGEGASGYHSGWAQYVLMHYHFYTTLLHCFLERAESFEYGDNHEGEANALMVEEVAAVFNPELVALLDVASESLQKLQNAYDASQKAQGSYTVGGGVSHDDGIGGGWTHIRSIRGGVNGDGWAAAAELAGTAGEGYAGAGNEREVHAQADSAAQSKASAGGTAGQAGERAAAAAMSAGGVNGAASAAMAAVAAQFGGFSNLNSKSKAKSKPKAATLSTSGDDDEQEKAKLEQASGQQAEPRHMMPVAAPGGYEAELQVKSAWWLHQHCNSLGVPVAPVPLSTDSMRRNAAALISVLDSNARSAVQAQQRGSARALGLYIWRVWAPAHRLLFRLVSHEFFGHAGAALLLLKFCTNGVGTPYPDPIAHYGVWTGLLRLLEIRGGLLDSLDGSPSADYHWDGVTLPSDSYAAAAGAGLLPAGCGWTPPHACYGASFASANAERPYFPPGTSILWGVLDSAALKVVWLLLDIVILWGIFAYRVLPKSAHYEPGMASQNSQLEQLFPDWRYRLKPLIDRSPVSERWIVSSVGFVLAKIDQTILAIVAMWAVCIVFTAGDGPPDRLQRNAADAAAMNNQSGENAVLSPEELAAMPLESSFLLLTFRLYITLHGVLHCRALCRCLLLLFKTILKEGSSYHVPVQQRAMWRLQRLFGVHGDAASTSAAVALPRQNHHQSHEMTLDTKAAFSRPGLLRVTQMQEQGDTDDDEDARVRERREQQINNARGVLKAVWYGGGAAPRKYRHNLCYIGDPRYAPICTYEVGFLVRFSLLLSEIINKFMEPDTITMRKKGDITPPDQEAQMALKQKWGDIDPERMMFLQRVEDAERLQSSFRVNLRFIADGRNIRMGLWGGLFILMLCSVGLDMYTATTMVVGNEAFLFFMTGSN
jgi:hypothetical protein